MVSADQVGAPTWRRTGSFRHRDMRHVQYEVVVEVTLGIPGPGIDEAGRQIDRVHSNRGRAGPFGSRFADLQHLAPFPITGPDQQRAWMSLIRQFEHNLILLDHEADSFTRKHWRYLHDRTSGYIGALSMLFKEAAHVAMDDSVEKVTREVMDRVVLGHDDEVDFARIKARRHRPLPGGAPPTRRRTRTPRPDDTTTPRRATQELRLADSAPCPGPSTCRRRSLSLLVLAHPDIYEQAHTFEMVHATARTPGASPDDYEWQRNSPLGDIYTIVFVRGLDEHEALRRLGAADEDIRLIDDGDHSYPEGLEVITVRRIGEWTVVIEDCGWRGSHREALCPLSRDGGEAVAVMRHDYAARHRLSYAADGEYLTDINPTFPSQRHGTEPDRLNRHLRELGIDPAADDHIDNPIAAALAVASRITGVMITPQHLRRPVLGAAIPGAY